MDEGCTVISIGLTGTEEMYFATTHFGADGGICVTASHNPINYNGMKMVQAGSAPLSQTSDLAAIREMAERNEFSSPASIGEIVDVASEARAAYVDRVVSFVDVATGHLEEPAVSGLMGAGRV